MLRFDAKTQIIISSDLSQDIWRILQEECFKHAVLIIDKNVYKHKDVKEFEKLISSKIKFKTFIIEANEPTTELVNEYKKMICREKNIDILVGIGGGSTIDLAKALSVMLVNEGSIEDYHGTGRSIKSSLKKIMVPTTAGTGSEVTPGAVLTNQERNFKRAVSGREVSPDYAVLNAKLTLTMPDSVTAFTGMDALAHAIESYTARNANDITRMYSKQAFSLVYNNLNKIFKNKQSLYLRRNILLGSCLAGYAIYNSNTGACHSIAYALGIYNNIPHGIAVAYLLPKIVKMNIEKGCYIYSDLYNLIEGRYKIDDSKTKAEKFLACLENYIAISYIKNNFRDYGVNEDNYEFLAEKGLELTPALHNNPVNFGLEDAKRVFKELL